MRISVIGCGYLGAVHAAALASLGFEVVGVDVDAGKIADLARGESPFFEPGLSELLASGTAAGRLRFTTDASAIADSEVHFVCVGTPQSSGSTAADMRFVDSAFTTVLEHAAPGSLVVGKSTVPVGTAARWHPAVTEAGVLLAWNPEFLREGHAVDDTLHPDRLVYGVADGAEEDAAVRLLDTVYAPMISSGSDRLVMDFQTAELVKTAANSFLATKISFINAMARLCAAADADVTVLADAIGLDDRIGRKFLNAGLGFGGGCLPKDIRAFGARAEELGAAEAVTFLREIDGINQHMRTWATDLVARTVLGGSAVPEADLTGVRVTVLGAAFKPNSDDVRDSPALDVARNLHARGARVTVTDPEAVPNASRVAPELGYEEDLGTAVSGADCLVLATEWQDYRDLDPLETASRVANPRIVDARNVLDPQAWRSAGWTYASIGRP